MTETFEHPADSADPRDESGASPLERFILDELEPQRDELNEWDSPRSHTKILLHTGEGQKLRSKQIGGKNSRAFTLSRRGHLLGGIDGAVTTLVSHHALRTANSGELTRQCLALSEIPHVPARTFHVSQYKPAVAFRHHGSTSVSLKPTAQAAQGGASANLATEEAFAEAWERAVAACSKLPAPHQQIDVEVYLPWIPLRVFVVGEDAPAALVRVPLYVVGDGVQSALQLAEQELQRRNGCRYLKPVEEESALDFLQSIHLEADTVLEHGHVQLLTYDRSGQGEAGWSVDVTDQVSAELFTLAVNATWAFPGMGAAAVDILTPTLGSADKALVSGVEPGADLREFRYPTYGQPRYPNLAIMRRISGAPYRT